MDAFELRGVGDKGLATIRFACDATEFQSTRLEGAASLKPQEPEQPADDIPVEWLRRQRLGRERLQFIQPEERLADSFPDGPNGDQSDLRPIGPARFSEGLSLRPPIGTTVESCALVRHSRDGQPVAPVRSLLG